MAGVTYGPAFYDKCLRVWDEMQTLSNEGRWTGHVTELLRELELPPSYAHDLMKVLEAAGTVSQLQRGSGRKPSVYLMVERPSPERYAAAVERLKPGIPPRELLEARRSQLLTELRAVEDSLSSLSSS